MMHNQTNTILFTANLLKAFVLSGHPVYITYQTTISKLSKHGTFKEGGIKLTSTWIRTAADELPSHLKADTCPILVCPA